MSEMAVADRRRRLWSDELLDTVDRWRSIDDPPAPWNRRRREGIRIFRHDLVERYLSRAHPVTPLFYTLPFAALGVWAGTRHTGLWGTVGLWVLGTFLWTLVEYVLHRWIFHWQPEGRGGKMWSFMVHGYHHEFPDDRMRLVAPPLMVLFFGVIVGALFYLVFGPERWLQVLAGLYTGYLAYDWIHYYTHHFHPTGGIGKWLRQYHLQHHFDPYHDRFGISSPLWDRILGTYRPVGRTRPQPHDP